MKIASVSRAEEVARLRRLLERAHSPRLHMFLIVSLTGAMGFIASFLMLHGGISLMWVRYPLAVLTAYLWFLFLLWVWLRLRDEEIIEHLDITDWGDGPGLPTFKGGGGTSAALAIQGRLGRRKGQTCRRLAAGQVDQGRIRYCLTSRAASILRSWSLSWPRFSR